MESIQHRWDCPAQAMGLQKAIVEPIDWVFSHADGSKTWRTHCEGCGRAAIRRATIIDKPQETTDEH